MDPRVLESGPWTRDPVAARQRVAGGAGPSGNVLSMGVRAGPKNSDPAGWLLVRLLPWGVSGFKGFV